MVGTHGMPPAAMLTVLSVLAVIPLGGCTSRTPGVTTSGIVGDVAEAIAPESEAAIRGFCGGCHRLPLPTSFPRDHWYREVRQGYDLYLAAGRSDLVRPVEHDAIRFFAAAAPERLAIPRAADRVAPPPRLRFEPLPLPDTMAIDAPAVAQVVHEASGHILTTDMRHGEVRRWRYGPEGWSSQVVARSSHPCRVVPVGTARGATTSGNGPPTYLLADLGSFLPADHDRGAVFEIGTGADSGSPRLVVGGLSRVVEARPCDFDGDDREDLLVAEFGWLSTGSLRVYLSASAADRGPAPSREQVLDPRHGVLGARVADLDGDGLDDIVAAFAQEHETVDVWWNRGPGRYEHETILTLPDPSYGSSAFEVSDLDGDGRPDVLHVNGDTMDSGLAKPSHAIRRLLNRGSAGFVIEEIDTMVGVCQASAVDLDLDGDTDIVAASLHPAAETEPPGTFDSLVWLELLPDGTYRRHTIERDRCDHAAFAVADVDSDGRPDIVAGCWRTEEGGEPRPPLSIFLNRETDGPGHDQPQGR